MFCECGCGREVKNRFIRGHSGHKWTRKVEIVNYEIECACGCGNKLMKYRIETSRGNEGKFIARKYIYGHMFKTIKRSPETYRKIVLSRLANGKSWSIPHTQIAKDKISKALKGKRKSSQMIDRLSRYLKARGWVAFKTGYFYSNKNQRDMFYRSSYELQSYKILEQLAIVDKYFYEPNKYIVSYKIDGKDYNYKPDLLVIYEDGSKHLIEVKPKKELDDFVNISKFASMRKYCSDKDITFTVWTEENLFSDKNGMKTVDTQTNLLHRLDLDNAVPSLIKKDNKEGVEVRGEIIPTSVPQSSNSDEMTRTHR